MASAGRACVLHSKENRKREEGKKTLETPAEALPPDTAAQYREKVHFNIVDFQTSTKHLFSTQRITAMLIKPDHVTNIHSRQDFVHRNQEIIPGGVVALQLSLEIREHEFAWIEFR
jgi:hypothetical protein